MTSLAMSKFYVSRRFGFSEFQSLTDYNNQQLTLGLGVI